MNIPITRGTTGLRTESDPVRSVYNAKAGGLRDLSACMNVDVSDAGRLSRRKGVLRRMTQNSGSPFSVNDNYLLFIDNDIDALSFSNDVATSTPIRNMTANRPVSYVLLDGTAYYTNGIEQGKVVDRVSFAWELDFAGYVGRNITRQFYGPPTGQRIAYYNGRFYIGRGKDVWYSEPYAPNVFAMGDSFLMLESNNKMVRPVAGGIYISDEYDTWFLSGSGPEDFKWDKVDNLPALPWSDTDMLGTMVLTKDGDYTLVKGKVQSAVWMTQQGVVFGGPSGDIEKLTDAKIDLPGEYSGGACLINGSIFIGVAL